MSGGSIQPGSRVRRPSRVAEESVGSVLRWVEGQYVALLDGPQNYFLNCHFFDIRLQMLRFLLFVLRRFKGTVTTARMKF